MAADIDCTWQAGNMGWIILCLYFQYSSVSMQAHGADIKFVGFTQQLLFQICILWIRIALRQWTQQCFLGKLCTVVKGAADADTDNHRRAGIGTGCLDRIQHKLLDTIQSFGRFQHFEC